MSINSDFDGATDVAWAAGMVAAQRACTLAEGRDWMQRQADATSRTLDEIALDVLDRRLHSSR